ncbi:MAG: FecR family protein [Treponema sp.]|nr:FecR family protein [Treponema sp.]
MKWFICAVLFAGGFSFLAAQTNEGSSDAMRAQIREITGRVELKAPHQEIWVNAVPGDYIEKETIIFTGFKSSALLMLGNSSLLVQPLTRLSLGEISAGGNNEGIDLELRTGRVRAEVRSPVGGKVNFAIKSHIATAAIRGTVFEFDTLNIRVAEGTVDFAPVSTGRIPPRAVPVSAGESSFVDTLTASAAAPSVIEVLNLSPPAPAGSAAPLSPMETPVTVTRTKDYGSLTINVHVTEKGN